VALAGATLFRMAIEPILGPGLQFLTYFPAVFVTAALAGFYRPCWRRCWARRSPSRCSPIAPRQLVSP